jgi:exonuclease SbcD
LDVRPYPDPQTEIMKAVRAKNISGAIVRLIYQIKPEQLSLISESEIQQELTIAHSYSITPEVITDQHPRGISALDPLIMGDPVSALESYLATRPDWEKFRSDLLILAQELMANPASENDQLMISMEYPN